MCADWPAPRAAAALRVARDRPFRACGSLACAQSPFRAELDYALDPSRMRNHEARLAPLWMAIAIEQQRQLDAVEQLTSLPAEL